MRAVVCDSSPLVYLSKLGRFALLRCLYNAVLIPPAVWQEVAIGGAGQPEANNLKTAVSEGWILIESASDIDSLAGAFPKDLGRGEMEAIALAREKRAILITDDALGRVAGRSLELEVTGTLGVLIRAKQHGNLVAVRPLIDSLKNYTNFRMSPEVYADALRIAGETEPS